MSREGKKASRRPCPGREEGLRQAQEIIAQAKTILNSALAGQEELARQLEHQLAKLALAIAEKIVGELAQEKEELVLHVANAPWRKSGRKQGYNQG